MFFIANWKMFGDLKSINSTKKVIKFSKNKKYKRAQIIYCPPYTLLDKFLKIHVKNQINNGAQLIQIFDSWAGLLKEKDLPYYIYEPTLSLITLNL